MKKIYFLLILLILPLSVHSLNYPSINSKVALIYDMNDERILYDINSDNTISIASLTKIATTITAIETINNLDEEVTITNIILNTVRWDASKAGLKNGDKLTYRDLLYASMVPSGADATNAIAILSAGNIDSFVNKMNDLAKRINLNNTHFVNVTGLDEENHYSTAKDILKLLKYSLNNPLFKEIFTTKEYTLSTGLTVKTTLNMYNKNNNFDTSVILGSKTGFTNNAGYCLASLSNINGHDIITILLGASNNNNDYYNIIDTINLITFLNNNYKDELLISKGALIKTIPILLSDIDTYEVYSSKDITKYLPSDYNINDFIIKYEGLESLDYHNQKDSIIGHINYYYNDELITSENVLLNTEIKLNIIKLIKKYYYIVILTSISLLLLVVLIIKKKRRKGHK